LSPASLNRGSSFPKWLFVGLATVALICGIFFRLWGLDHKLYTNDEATTSVHVSGHTIADYNSALAAGKITTAGAALHYQLIDSSRSMSSVVAALALEDPQHPPVFYVLARFWEEAMGSTITARRALPALFGVLVLPAAFVFGCELIGRRFGLLLASLVAVSPFHILYSQQVREYSLWTFFAFASSAALLHALRAPRQNGAARVDIGAWTIFALLTASGMYTYTGYLLILLAQVIYVVVAYRREIRERVLPFAIAACVALAVFAPWLSAMMAHGGAVTKNGYLAAPLPLQAIVLKWFFNVGAVFFDLDYIWHPSAVIVLGLLLLAGFGLVSVMRERPLAGGYLFAIGFLTAAAFILRDILDHQSTSTAIRYLIPAWIALEGVVSYGVWKLYVDERFSRKVVALSIFAVLLLCGVGSAAVSATRQSWWGDDSVAPIGPMARTIDAAQSPVTVVFRNDLSDFNFAPMLLSYEIPANTRFELLTGNQLPDFRTTNGDTFLLDPSAELRRAVIARGMRLREVYAEVTPKDDLASLRQRAAQARAGVGYVAPKSSLWLVPKRGRQP
jgi:uncharacterized membrane protein